MKIRALIIEDEPLARQTIRGFARENDWLAVVGEAADGATAIDLIDSLKPQLIFLDVQIPEISGLEVLNCVKHQPAVIFTTAFDQYALKAFEQNAFDYLLKPFGRERFQVALKRVRRRLAEESNSNKTAENDLLKRIFVRRGNTIINVKIEQISRFEADDDYVKAFVEGNYYLLSQTLSDLEMRLDKTQFCRIHRSHIVNLEFVKKAQTQDRRLLIILKDDTEILASRAGSQTLRKLIF